MITASLIQDFGLCQHRVTLELRGDQGQRKETDSFVVMLKDRKLRNESDVVNALGVTANLKYGSYNERLDGTLTAMSQGEALIYGGLLMAGDMVSEPTLLELRNGKYIPGEIAFTAGVDADGNLSKSRQPAAMKIAHHLHVLDSLGFHDGSLDAFVIDRNGDRSTFNMGTPIFSDGGSWLDSYQRALSGVRNVQSAGVKTTGALCANCKLCPWQDHCKSALIEARDLSLVAELGASKRDAMISRIANIDELARIDVDDFVIDGERKKTVFPGIGKDSLAKFKERAKLLVEKGSRPYLKAAIELPTHEKEVFFDLEADPITDIVYLHGFVEREHGRPDTSRFIPVFLDCDEDEGTGFAEAYAYLLARLQDSTVYYYSKFELTAYRSLAKKYPEVCSVSDIDTMFERDNMIDLLYDVVAPYTEWPTYDRSIKTLAKYLGFQWRDENPSGSASIEWYGEWVETGDARVKERILQYNEDDNLATGVVLDGIRRFEIKRD